MQIDSAMAKLKLSRSTSPSHHRQIRGNNQLRIIGGIWRGRKLTFPDSAGLRPTPNRVRETLFNWLAATVHGSNCLDLFSGSGALGLEALSRGAAEVEFVDSSTVVTRKLQENLLLLKSNSKVWNSSAENQLLSYVKDNAKNNSNNTDNPSQKSFDIIFLDPPFGQNLLAPCIELIVSNKLLSAKGWIYIETGASESIPALPENWHLHREKTAGQVCYRLFHDTCS